MAACLALFPASASTQDAFSQCWLWLAVVARLSPYGRCCKVCFSGMLLLFRLIVRSQELPIDACLSAPGDMDWSVDKLIPGGGCLQFVHSVKVPDAFGSFMLWNRLLQVGSGTWCSGQRLGGWGPCSLDQSELQHGSVILKNYILIWLCYHNTRPLFWEGSKQRSHRFTDSIQTKTHWLSKPTVSMWKQHTLRTPDASA